MTAIGPITVAVVPAPAAQVGVDTDLELEFANVGRVACRSVVVEFAVRRPLLLAHGDRRIELDRLGAGERHRHPIRLRATAAGSGTLVLRTFSYQDVLGHTVDAGGTTLPVTVMPPSAPSSRVGDDRVPAGETGPHRRRRSDGAMPSVFVSHRSSDSPWFVRDVVKHLRHQLRPHPVFVDRDLAPGEIWPHRLEVELQRCAVLVALIGPSWASGSDVLRHEITSALARRVLLIPVLFDGAPAPRRDTLPPDIAALADRQAIAVDHGHFEVDMKHLEREVRRALTG